MKCPTCASKHHEQLEGLVKCERCYCNGEMAQLDRVAESKGVREDSPRPYLRDMREGTNRGGVDH